MLMSRLLGNRYKEWPADAVSKSHGLLLRGGYIRQVATGIYSYLPLAQRVSNKIIKIIKEEMEKINFEEVLMPVVMPKELWEESGRYGSIDDELVRFKDRTDHDMLLAMTHEEAVVQLARTEATTYTKYPIAVYQVQTKFRDEPRPRGGLIRVREFLMKDAYSFHTTQEDLDECYEKCFSAYINVFERVGLKNFVVVESDSGMMGGSKAHEFMLLCQIGENSIAICPQCDYKANVEVAKGILRDGGKSETPRTSEGQEVFTPSIKTIDALQNALKIPKDKFIKACAFDVQNHPKPVIIFIRGDFEVNETKLRTLLKGKCSPRTISDSDGLCWGFIGPVGLDSQKYDIYYDESLRGATDMVCGANKQDYHIKGVDIGALDVGEFVDVYKVTSEMFCPVCKNAKLEIKNGIEIGNIFELGEKYTKSMNMLYVDKDGREKHPVMGCYGIGITRLLAAIVEESNDENGPIWPVSVAPFEVSIVAVGEKTYGLAKKLYDELSENFDVLLDDRDLSAGVKFADADLIGAPVRVVLGSRGIESGEFEVSTRDKKSVFKVKYDEIKVQVAKLL
ncbi:MAG: proline--tRNA ligase [Oscillospiraceae bacterium]|jgi:prolyl-tRNA synthetase|nr:proline--tRNA ligase [Oscillospiraceae bacterium]